jgi:hypothetical protein
MDEQARMRVGDLELRRMRRRSLQENRHQQDEARSEK